MKLTAAEAALITKLRQSSKKAREVVLAVPYLSQEGLWLVHRALLRGRPKMTLKEIRAALGCAREARG